MSAHGSRSYQSNSGVAVETDDASDDVTTPVEKNRAHSAAGRRHAWHNTAIIAMAAFASVTPECAL